MPKPDLSLFDPAKPIGVISILKLTLACILAIGFMGAILFGLAGMFAYPGAWLLLAAFAGLCVWYLGNFLVKDPEYLGKRMNRSEGGAFQKRIKR